MTVDKRSRRHESQIVNAMWDAAGQPDGRGETEVNYGSYRQWVGEVLAAIDHLGLKVVRK